MDKQKGLILETYSAETADQWKESKTMEHPSGVWGRDPMLKYLESEIIKPDDKVVDLGSGGGYPTIKTAEMVGPNGQVVGIEYSGAQLGLEGDAESLAKKYEAIKNVSFIQGDIKNIPLEPESMNKAISLMVLHNLPIDDVKSVLTETARVLKPGGKAVFLTMHPDAYETENWDIDFWKRDPENLNEYKQAEDKEGIRVKSVVKNVSGGEKTVFANIHTRENMISAIEEAGLKLVDEKDLSMDEETAREKFGQDSIRTMPDKPVFWIITLEK